MAAREKKQQQQPTAAAKGDEPPSPRLTQSGRVVKSRLSIEQQADEAKKQQQQQQQQQEPTAQDKKPGGEAVAKRRGRPPLKAKAAAAAAAAASAAASVKPNAKTKKKADEDGGAPKKKATASKVVAAKVRIRAKRLQIVKAKRAKSKAAAAAPKIKVEKESEPVAAPGAAASSSPPPPAPPTPVEVKKEPEPTPTPTESPLAAFDSRSPSPRNPRKRRTSSDLLLDMNQQREAASSLSSSSSLDPKAKAEPAAPSPHKSLRNGKQRSLKDALLADSVEQELKKRKRLASESIEPKPAGEAAPEEECPKRPRSDEATDVVDEPPEKLTEKTLILDNMSKAFNDAAVADKAKNPRRSARQRKSTAKAKERDEETTKAVGVKPEDADQSDASSSVAGEKGAVDEAAADPEAKAEGPPVEEAPAAGKDEDDDEERVDDSSKENVQNCSYTHQDFDKLIDRLKCLEEEDNRKRQEEISKLNSRSVVVTTDVVPKDKAIIEESSPVVPVQNKDVDVSPEGVSSLATKEGVRKSFDIDLPSGVTLIKKSAVRKRSSESRDAGDSVTMIDKCLGKEVILDIRKSIDNGVLTIEPSKPARQVPEKNDEYLPFKCDKVSDSNFALPIDESTLKRNSLEIISIPSTVTVLTKTRPDPVEEGAPSEIIRETPERQRQKEEVLKTLGLLTLEAANQAKIDKQKQKELIKSNKASTMNKYPGENYTGTLKTVIKLNRDRSPDKKKGRSSLKMTFQKSKNRGGSRFVDMSGDSESDESPYYTIHKEFGGSSGSGTGSSDNHMTSGGHRKTHYSNRFNNHESGPLDTLNDIPVEAPTKEAAANLVIPEKASSFSIHPGRLCQDQCFYCGGKFGLFDTPCHIAQIKSSERQKKILENEEKLTIDSCLCDACYRHVDRRANCPSYRKKAGPGSLPLLTPNAGIGDVCHVNMCGQSAPHTLRRKWLVKMRKNISKVVQMDLDYPGLHTIPLCENHYRMVTQLMVCSLCKRKLSRNHVHYINQDKILNPLLQKQGIPVVFEDKPVVCKSCRYFCTLLLRPPTPNEPNKLGFLKSHHRRLIQAHNVTLPDDSDTDFTDEPSTAQDTTNDQKDSSKDKKRGKTAKNKTKKSIGNKLSDENVNSKNSLQVNSETPSSKIIMEDVESLIASNKILVPGAGPNVSNQVTGVSSMAINDSDVIEYDNPLIAELDKRSELHNSLQKWNVPSSTVLQIRPKSKNILKVHNAPASNKSQGQRKLSRSEKRIQKLGQIITSKTHFEDSVGNKLPNRSEFTIEPMDTDGKNSDSSNHMLRNIALNEECTIETIPPKTGKNPLDINSLKSKWQSTESFSKVKRNLSALSAEQSQKKSSGQNDFNYSNPVHRLEINPSISVRELLPGEEEMNLHCNIEFGNIKGVTPEGWEKCNTTIQYDADTKNLWQELQRPYGNQSSFLRHLILLEKYFRNGDLILSQYANSNAITYSESVQNRLRSYDNISSNGEVPTNCMPNMNSLRLTHNLTNTSASGTEQAKKSDIINFRKPSVNIGPGKSLLKSNQYPTAGNSSGKVPVNTHKNDASLQSGGKSNKKSYLSNSEVEPIAPNTPKNIPVILNQLEKLGNQLTPIQVPVTPRPPTPRPDVPKTAAEMCRTPALPPSAAADIKTSTPKTDAATNKSKVTSLPPELIAINQTSLHKKNIESVVKNIQLKGSSTPTAANPPAAVQPPATLSSSFAALSPIGPQAKPAKPSVKEGGVGKKKGKGASKQWRPTLIPITDESKAESCRDVLHQTADGRRLPSLVQVLSGGKPYFITIQDYNKMCIMRREKLQQENLKKEESMKKKSANAPPCLPPNLSEVSGDSSSIVLANSDINAGLPSIESAKSNKSFESSANTEDTSNATKSPLTDAETQSLLKNVSLKNVTIAPVTSLEAKSPVLPPLNNPQSLLITSAKSIMQVPAIISQLNPSISVTAETINNHDVGPIPSMAMIMPKIPKSLTVIPQTINNNAATLVTLPAIGEPLSVLPLSANCTSAPALTVSPAEP